MKESEILEKEASLRGKEGNYEQAVKDREITIANLQNDIEQYRNDLISIQDKFYSGEIEHKAQIKFKDETIKNMS